MLRVCGMLSCSLPVSYLSTSSTVLTIRSIISIIIIIAPMIGGWGWGWCNSSVAAAVALWAGWSVPTHCCVHTAVIHRYNGGCFRWGAASQGRGSAVGGRRSFITGAPCSRQDCYCYIIIIMIIMDQSSSSSSLIVVTIEGVATLLYTSSPPTYIIVVSIHHQ